jgi:hypothetical protein
VVDDKGEKNYVFYSPIKGDTGWSMAVVCSDKEIFRGLRQVGFNLLLLMLAGLALMGYIIVRSVRNFNKLQTINAEKERIGSELRIANRIQMGMLPKIFPPYPDRNDVEIFADVDCVIYVNKIENSYTVQKNNISQSVTPKNAEEQQYVILLYPVDGGEENNFTWSSVIGRQNAYEIIKSEFPSEAWDPDKSFVLVGNVKLDDALSVTEFVNYLKNSNLIPEDEFFIENYKIGDYYDGDSESD